MAGERNWGSTANASMPEPSPSGTQGPEKWSLLPANCPNILSKFSKNLVLLQIDSWSDSRYNVGKLQSEYVFGVPDPSG